MLIITKKVMMSLEQAIMLCRGGYTRETFANYKTVIEDNRQR